MKPFVEDSSVEDFVEAFVEALVEVASVEAFIFSYPPRKASVEVTPVNTSITLAKASITSIKASMKASMEDFVEVNFVEAFVDSFVEAPVEVTSVQYFIFSISSMKASVEVTSVKASITSAKLPLLP